MRLAARLHAIIRQRCPVCFQGAMFRGRFEMSATCPVCGHRFEREPGFFQGAMYVSYGIGIVYIGVLAILANAFLVRSEEHTSELQSQSNLVCRLLLEKKKKNRTKC